MRFLIVQLISARGTEVQLFSDNLTAKAAPFCYCLPGGGRCGLSLKVKGDWRGWRDYRRGLSRAKRNHNLDCCEGEEEESKS